MTSAENGRARLLLPALLLLGLLLRVPGMLSDFWLDEIWAWRLATSLSSPAAIFDAYHSANHHLYTLFL
ncbi:MAG: hypothetical protein OXU20_37000, partial [Myxococcales bacterium]|nr:hypothetical protein [Myxococcales bacterium]MDD9970284.1 hypothetical protein [Myxococcales bacterium]